MLFRLWPWKVATNVGERKRAHIPIIDVKAKQEGQHIVRLTASMPKLYTAKTIQKFYQKMWI